MSASLTRKSVLAARNWLNSIGFEPHGQHPIRYFCVVLSMTARPGTQVLIKEGAIEVAKLLGLGLESEDDHPRFHFGYKSTRKYYCKQTTRWVGRNHTFDDLSPYCVSHRRYWKESNHHDDPCTRHCIYGFRYQGKTLTSQLIQTTDQKASHILASRREAPSALSNHSAKRVIEDFRRDFGITDPNLFKVAYSPLKPSPVLLVGDSPGGDPNDPTTVANYKEDYQEGEHDFLDENYPLAVKMRQLFSSAFGARSNEVLGSLPTTNVSFFRSPRQLSHSELSRNREKCLPYFSRLVQIIRPKLILCNGMSVFRYFKSRMVSVEEVDQAASPPATGQQVYYRKVRGAFSLLDSQVVYLVGFHHLSGYRWSNQKLADLAIRIHKDWP